jgi:hypothetical protein
MARSTIPPSFEPGSGWYRPGPWSPSAPAEYDGMRTAAWPATVVVLRRRGVRIPAAELIEGPGARGLLVCSDRFTKPHFHARLYADATMGGEQLPRLMHAKLERENGGVRLYGGLEVDRHEEFRQAWLCAATPERLGKILLAMLAQEGGS